MKLKIPRIDIKTMIKATMLVIAFALLAMGIIAAVASTKEPAYGTFSLTITIAASILATIALYNPGNALEQVKKADFDMRYASIEFAEEIREKITGLAETDAVNNRSQTAARIENRSEIEAYINKAITTFNEAITDIDADAEKTDQRIRTLEEANTTLRAHVMNMCAQEKGIIEKATESKATADEVKEMAAMEQLIEITEPKKNAAKPKGRPAKKK